MATYLRLGPAEPWRLPPDTDTDDLLDHLEVAFETSATHDVVVESDAAPDGRITLRVNPRALGFWAMYDAG